jgi:hypothetical protein
MRCDFLLFGAEEDLTKIFDTHDKQLTDAFCARLRLQARLQRRGDGTA